MKYLFSAIFGIAFLFLGMASGVDAAYEVAPASSLGSASVFREDVLVTEVIDGDSIIVRGTDNEVFEVRIIGIDAPETFKAKTSPFRCFAEHAKDYAENLLLGKTVTIEREVSDVDVYGRKLRHVVLSGNNIAFDLLNRGYARVLSVAPDTIYIEQYGKTQLDARSAKRGIWSNQCSSQIITSTAGSKAQRISGYGLGGAQGAVSPFFGFGEGFNGGVSVAAGDIDKDYDDEIIIGAGKGGGPHVRTFRKDGSPYWLQFFAFDKNFRGGINVASGDVNDDGKADIAVAQASEGQAWIKVYRHDGRLLAYFNAFGAPEVGASIALGDIDNDAKDELIVGAGPGGGPHIRVYDISDGLISGINQGASLKPIQFFAFDKNNRSGIHVASGDVDGDGKDEIGACQGEGDQAWCKVYRYNDSKTVLGEWRAYGDSVYAGASIAMADVDHDGRAEVITAPGKGGGPQVRVFESDGSSLFQDFFAYDQSFRGGVNVAFAHFWKDVN